MGKIETLPGTLPPMPAVARVLSQFDRAKLGAAIEVMIALLDLTDGEPDAEDSDPAEPDGDCADIAWPEWHQRGRHKLAGGTSEMPGGGASEDDEADGDETDGNGAEDEPCGWFATHGDGPGCALADPGGSDSGLCARECEIVPDYGPDQSLGPVGHTHADQVRRWNALPTVPPLNRGNYPLAT